MKKCFIIVLFVFILTLTGCYDYSYGAEYGRLLDITYFDTNNEEITGEYLNYRELYDKFLNKKSNNNLKPLNSPSPIYNYYYAYIDEGTDVIVRFKIKCNNGYEFTSLIINDVTYRIDDFTNKQVDGNILYLDLLYSNITSTNNEYAIGDIFFQITKNDKVKVERGTTWVESRTYIKGFLFVINDGD